MTGVFITIGARTRQALPDGCTRWNWQLPTEPIFRDVDGLCPPGLVAAIEARPAVPRLLAVIGRDC